MSLPRPILVLQTGDPVPSVEAKRGSFARMIQETIGELWTHSYAVVDARLEDPKDATEYSAIVITGSSANVPTRDAWIVRTEAWLRGAVATSTPIFGICFGHQILAQALGGEVIRNPRGREIGTLQVKKKNGANTGNGAATVDDPLFRNLPAEFTANVTHIDTVGRLPEGAESLASSSLENHQAIKFTNTCYGVQFHPEIDGEIMRGYIASRREILASEGMNAERLEAEASDAQPGADTLRHFVRHFLRP